MQITLNSPLDMHIHFRQEAMLRLVAPLSAGHFAGGVIMPNLVPPVDNRERLLAYSRQVTEAIGSEVFEPFMTLFFRKYTEQELLACKDDIIGIKLYPAGVTTNSEDGIADIADADETLRLMQELGIPLLVHGETHGFVLNRESDFIPVYEKLASSYPKLKIIMEHITTRAAAEVLDKYENLFATITVHHLLATMDDLGGGLLDPHLFCKPVVKSPYDREALLQLALEAHPKVMFGSDSAPHPVEKKHSPAIPAGAFTAPVALPLLAELFANHNACDHLQHFVLGNAADIYQLTNIPRKVVTLEDTPFTIPESYDNVRPLFSGKEVGWSIKSIET